MGHSLVKKTIKFSGDCTAANESVCAKAVKCAVKRTPGIAKVASAGHNEGVVKTASLFKANESLAKRRKSLLETEMSRQQLVDKLEAVMAENGQIRRERTKCEADLRSELTAKWSKREEETEEYYQEQIREQRKQVGEL